ncbi:MAG: thermonuclease family protein [Acidobacteriota bacterium]|nr:thermonuclease family protein [Acidobacteriota bacterium]
MKRQFILTTFLFLVGTNFAKSQLPPRDINQIRNETSARNRAIENYDRNNPNGMNTVLYRNERLIRNGKIPSSAIRSYVLAAQVSTEVKVLTVGSGDVLLVDDGTNKVVIRILGIDAPEAGQPVYEEAKRNLSDLLLGKKVVLKYSLHNLKDDAGYFPARVFIGGKDVGLNLLENGFAWYNEKDKYFFEKKDDKENVKAEADAQVSKLGVWKDEKPQKPWEYKKKLEKEKKKAAKS